MDDRRYQRARDPEAWARSEMAKVSQASRRDRSVLIAFGIRGQFIYIHPETELVIIRMASARPRSSARTAAWF
jgi:hypothetical protein